MPTCIYNSILVSPPHLLVPHWFPTCLRMSLSCVLHKGEGGNTQRKFLLSSSTWERCTVTYTKKHVLYLHCILICLSEPLLWLLHVWLLNIRAEWGVYREAFIFHQLRTDIPDNLNHHHFCITTCRRTVATCNFHIRHISLLQYIISKKTKRLKFFCIHSWSHYVFSLLSKNVGNLCF